MKRALVLTLALLFLSGAAWARTDYFDAVTIAGAFTLTGTAATAFTGTTLAVDMSSTAVIDGATSVRNLSAGFNSLESPANRFGVSATVYTQIATTATTGVTAITHTGTGPTMAWTVPVWTNTNSTSYTTYTPSWVLGFDAGSSVTAAVADTTGALTVSHTGNAQALSWTVPTATWTHATSDTIYTPSFVVGFDAGSAVTFAVADTSGAVTITHAGNATAVNWTATNFDFIGAIALDGVSVSGAVGMLDDQVLTLGTTTGSAATKITAEFDETTTGIGALHIGTSAEPQVLNVNPGSSTMAMTLNVNQSTGAGDLDDYVGFYNKINMVGAGDGNATIVADAPRAYVGLTGGANNSVAAQAYASQPWAKHEGTGALTAMSAISAKLDVSADNFTASTINAGHFHIEGAATVTSTMFDGVMIEVYPDVTNMDSGLRIAVDTGAVVADGIAFIGVMTDGIDMSGATLTNDIVLHHGGTIVNTAGVTTITDTAIGLAGNTTVTGTLSATVPTSYEALLSSTPITLAQADTHLYTVPTGKSCVITRIIVRSASATFDQAQDAVMNMGWDAGVSTVFASATLVTPVTATTWEVYTLVAPGVIGTTGQILHYNVTTPATTAATSAVIDVFGYLF
jgi:hypothetical protein